MLVGRSTSIFDLSPCRWDKYAAPSEAVLKRRGNAFVSISCTSRLMYAMLSCHICDLVLSEVWVTLHSKGLERCMATP